MIILTEIPFGRRASSNIWTKLYLKNKLSNGADNELQKYFSTHPVEDTRAGKHNASRPQYCKISEMFIYRRIGERRPTQTIDDDDALSLKLQTISLLLDQLDLNIPAALHLRKSCSCPPLPHVDPRSEYHFTRKFIDSLKEDELESVRAAPDEDAVTAIMQEIMDKRVVEKVRFWECLKGISELN